MLKQTRMQRIIELLHANGEIEISSLCRTFGVTEMTIRRDLDALAKEEKLIRTHGGAILAGEVEMAYAPFECRLVENADAKRKIAKKAQEFLQDGKTVFFDSGTTVYSIIEEIPSAKRITVVTNGINVGNELISRRHISTILVGGELNRRTLATQGILAEDLLEHFRADVAFIGTRGIGDDGALYVMGISDTGLKRKVMSIAEKVYVVADSSKLGKTGLISFANASECSGLIVDSGISGEIKENLEKAGINLIIAE